MAGCDRIALVQALADLAGRRISAEEATAVLDHSAGLPAHLANKIWSQHGLAPAR